MKINAANEDGIGRDMDRTVCSSPTMKRQLLDLFELAKIDDYGGIERIVDEEGCSPDDKDDMGRTALHICAYHGYDESTQKLISLGASLNVPDFESGWTPLHRALYHGHLKVSLLLIKAGASLGDNWRSNNDDWKTIVQPKKEPQRAIRNISKWKCPIDHDGLSPLDLLSYRLMDNLKVSKKLRSSTSIHAFGKSDFMLGVPLPRASDIVRPKRLEKFANEDIYCVKASKHHSMALTIGGDVYTWGHGRSGRLGHGDESTHPVPTLIDFFHSKSIKIKVLSTAENHSLAVTTSGDVFSWGSDRYGQLGHNISDTGMSLLPRRIDYFKKMNVLSVAAGTMHSLCRTDEDLIYSWGSNKHAQLGIRSNESTSLSNGSGPGSASPKQISLGRGNGTSNNHYGRLTVISLAAGTYNSLALVKNPNLSHFGHTSLNEVYQWGHGCVNPMKVHFNASSSKCSKERSTVISETARREKGLIFGPPPRREIVNISAGLNHNCAVSSDGQLYTWGLGSDQLGHGEDNHVNHQLSSPQLVEALLPENGGGRVTQASASNTHTCVVTDKGDVYSWGSSIELPESSATFQPVPRRVVGIKRAVQVASGADHTIVLCTATLPSLPHNQVQPLKRHQVSTPVRNVITPKNDSLSNYSVEDYDHGTDPRDNDSDGCEVVASIATEILTLKQLCEIQIAKNVDISNVANVLEFATQHFSTDITAYCSSFLLKNLDGVLMQCRPNDLDTLISDTLETHRFRRQSSGSFTSVSSCGRGSPRLRSDTGVSESDMSETEKDTDNMDTPTKRRGSLSKDDMNLEGVTRFVKQTKKRLGAIYELETKLISGELVKDQLQAEQIAKLERKTMLESELKRVELIMCRLENEERLITKVKTRQTRVESEKKGIMSCGFDTIEDFHGGSHSLNDTVLTPIGSSPMIKIKGKKKTVSLTAMPHKTLGIGQPPSSFAEWLNVSAPSPGSAPAGSSLSSSSSSSSSSTTVWGKADGNEDCSPAIALKDVILSQSEPLAKSAPISSMETMLSPNRHKDLIEFSTPPSSFDRKSSFGKKVKVSLAEFMSRSEKKTSTPSKLAPWSASKAGDATISHPSSDATTVTAATAAAAAAINGAPQAVACLSGVACKPSFAEIQQQEEELRKQSNIQTLKGNESPWFIDRRERAESLDVIMAKQQYGGPREDSISSLPTMTSEKGSSVILNVAAVEYKPSISSSSSSSSSKSKSKSKSKSRKESNGSSEKVSSTSNASPSGKKKRSKNMEKSSNVREGLEEAIDGGKDECMSRGRSGDGSNNGNGSKKGNGSGVGGDRAKRNYTRKSL